MPIKHKIIPGYPLIQLKSDLWGVSLLAGIAEKCSRLWEDCNVKV